MEKEQWVGAALFMIGLLFLIGAISYLWALTIVSSALSLLPPEYQGTNPFGGILALAWLFALIYFFTGILSMVAGIVFASSVLKKTTAFSQPQRTDELYDKLLGAYKRVYGPSGKRRLEKKINSYIESGLSQEEAIRKAAQDEGL